MAKGVRQTLSQSAIYGLGTVISNAASLIMLPIYTHYLSPQDYGMLEMLQMLADLTSIVFGMRITSGVLRIYFDSDDERSRRTVMSTAWLTDLGLHSVGIVFLLAFAAPASNAFLGSSTHSGLVSLFALSLAPLVMYSIPMAYIRALQRPWTFTLVSVAKLLLQVGLNVYFVVCRNLGPFGVVLSTLITTALFGACLSAWLFARTGFQLDLAVGKRMLNFGIPIALASVGAFYTTYGDRFFLQHFWSLAEVGLYALAYRFAFALNALIYGTVDQAWSTQSYIVYKQDNRHEVFGRMFFFLMCGMLFVGTTLSVLAHDIIRVMSDSNFLGAWICIPPLALAYVIRAAGDFCGFGIRLHEKTRDFLWASVMSVVVMTIGYVSLIPPYGSFGAALATLFGMSAEFWWIRRRANLLEPIPLPWRRVSAMAASCTAIFCLSLLLPRENLLLSVVSRCALLAVSGLLVFYSPIVGMAERHASAQLLRDVVRKLKVT